MITHDMPKSNNGFHTLNDRSADQTERKCWYRRIKAETSTRKREKIENKIKFKIHHVFDSKSNFQFF